MPGFVANFTRDYWIMAVTVVPGKAGKKTVQTYVLGPGEVTPSNLDVRFVMAFQDKQVVCEYGLKLVRNWYEWPKGVMCYHLAPFSRLTLEQANQQIVVSYSGGAMYSKTHELGVTPLSQRQAEASPYDLPHALFDTDPEAHPIGTNHPVLHSHLILSRLTAQEKLKQEKVPQAPYHLNLKRVV